MAELTQRDLNFITRNLPADIRELLRSTPGLILGGGFIRGIIAGEKVSDIDLFGPNKEVVFQKATQLAISREGKVHTTDNAFTVLSPPRRPVQFIHRWIFDDPIKCVESFDFTVCQAGIWWGQEVVIGEITADEQGNTTGHATIKHTWKSYCHENFYSDLAAKRLVYTYPDRLEDAGGSFLRVRTGPICAANGRKIPTPPRSGQPHTVNIPVRRARIAQTRFFLLTLHEIPCRGAVVQI